MCRRPAMARMPSPSTKASLSTSAKRGAAASSSLVNAIVHVHRAVQLDWEAELIQATPADMRHHVVPQLEPARPRVRPVYTQCNIHGRSEEHTSELQSHVNLVCRLLLEKKKKT